MALTDFQRIVARQLRDDSGRVTPEDVDEAIELARVRYSKDRPHRVVEDVTAPGGQELTAPAGWVGGFSEPVQIEYPVGTVPPVLIDEAEVYEGPSGEKILLGEAISAGAAVRLTYTVFHELSAAADTIPVGDREAVACYAAGLLLEQLATVAAHESDSTLQADSVDRGARSRQLQARAKVLMDRYHNELGIDPKRNAAAGAVANWDVSESRGHGWLLRGRRYR
jgi:hypothetical protein